MDVSNKINAKQLAEYLHATPNRRSRIIRDIIEPQIYIMDRYNGVDRAISSFLESNTTDPKALDELDKKTHMIKSRNDNHENRILNTFDAIEMAKKIDLGNLPSNTTISTLPKLMPRIDIGGMAVSVKPTNLIVHKKNGTRKWGAIKPYISKSKSLTADDAMNISTLLQWYCEEVFGKEKSFAAELCLIIDIFAQETFAAPKRQKNRRKILEECCLEIHDRIPAMYSRILNEVKSTEKRASA